MALTLIGGTGLIYRYEDFSNGTPTFKLISEMNPNPQIAVIPQNYRGAIGDNLSDIGTITGYPTISWENDVYNVWLAQNTNLINLKMQNLADQDLLNRGQNIANTANSLIPFFGGSSSNNQTSINNQRLSNISGGLSTFSNSILNTQQLDLNYEYQVKLQTAEMDKQRMLPNQGTFGGNNATLLGYGLFDKNIFTRYTIKKEFAKTIDDYFSMFGYKINQVKIPNINNRPNWNYIQTIDCNITGNIPETALLSLKAIFNNGLTLWHNPQTFLDYSKNNR